VDTRDDIIVDYKPPLSLQKATWVDNDKNRHISQGDYLRFEFSRYLKSGEAISYGNASPAAAGIDLLFSSEVQVANFIATSTPASSTEILVELAAGATDSTFFPGSSTVIVSPTNDNLMDNSNVKANGTSGEYPALEIIIKAN
jgi:hypothetical protein